MSKKQFTLDLWLKDKSQKVVTRCGFPVRIVCTDVKRKDYPILALVERDDQEEYQSFTKDGRFSLYNPLHDNFDLFIETADEVSEDEKILEIIKHCIESRYLHTSTIKGISQKQCLAWLEKQGSLKDIIDRAKDSWYNEGKIAGMAEGLTDDEKYQQGWHDALENQSEKHPEPYNGISFEYNGHIWGMCARDNGVDISCDKHLIKHLEKQDEQEKDILEDAILDDYILDDDEDGLIAETIRYKKEKQAEQNQTDKVKPKFKVGDWIINPRTGLIKHIKNVLLCDNNGNYEFESSSMSIDSVDNSFHLWTIADARSGDVLVNWNNTIFIFKAIEDETIKFHIAYNEKWDAIKTPSTKLSHLGFPEPQFEFHPATEEQRNLLFRKMKEAGYEWDARNKVMTKIEQKPADSYCQENCKGFQETGKCFADGECKAKRESDQKPEENKGNIGGISPNWSEEDKGIIEEVVSYLINYSNIVESKEDADRIEYLIDKIQDICPYQKQEWSEEDEQHIDSLLKRLDALCRNKFERTRFAISEDRDWLKSLRPQKCLIPSEEEIEKAAQEWDSKANFNPFYMTMENGKPTGVKQSITTHKESFKVGVNWILKFLKDRLQLKQEWSDVGKDILSRIIDDLKFLRDTVSIDPKYAVSIIDMEREITWLNSLRPQNKWKPSDEQMEALDWQVENTSVSSWQYKATKELMEDLKKLKEE